MQPQRYRKKRERHGLKCFHFKKVIWKKRKVVERQRENKNKMKDQNFKKEVGFYVRGQKSKHEWQRTEP